MIAEIGGVEGAAGPHGTILQAGQTSGNQQPSGLFVIAAVVADHLAKAGPQRLVVNNPEQVIAQVIAKGAVIVRGLLQHPSPVRWPLATRYSARRTR